MPRRAAGLSARRIQTESRPGLYGDGGGLYLQVSGNAKTWIYRFSIAGRRRDMGLGSTSIYSLAEARAKANEARRLVADGVDPIDRRTKEAAAAALANAKVTAFRECGERYIAVHRPAWRNDKHAAQWSSTLETYVYPIMGDLPVQDVDTGLVMKVLEQNVADDGEPPATFWTAKPETASRVRGRIEVILDWATARGYRQGENPARWRGHLENLLPKKSKVRRVEHHAALPYAEIAAFMVKLRKQEGVGARALEFAILTAARTNEAIGAKWEEINLDDRLWTIPPERMKAAREHRVPLSAPAIAVLEDLAKVRQGEFVFPGGRTGRPPSNMILLMVLRRMKRDDLTAHGFRSTFSDWCAEKTDFPSEVREMALAHVVGDKVEAAYRRGDLFEKRRQLAEAWAKFCFETPAASRVVAIRGR